MCALNWRTLRSHRFPRNEGYGVWDGHTRQSSPYPTSTRFFELCRTGGAPRPCSGRYGVSAWRIRPSPPRTATSRLLSVRACAPRPVFSSRIIFIWCPVAARAVGTGVQLVPWSLVEGLSEHGSNRLLPHPFSGSGCRQVGWTIVLTEFDSAPTATMSRNATM